MNRLGALSVEVVPPFMCTRTRSDTEVMVRGFKGVLQTTYLCIHDFPTGTLRIGYGCTEPPLGSNDHNRDVKGLTTCSYSDFIIIIK